MDKATWVAAVQANVAERLTGPFDWQRITDAVWSAGYVAGLQPEVMGLVVVIAKAVAECTAAIPPQNPPPAPAAPHVVAAVGKATGAAGAGS